MDDDLLRDSRRDLLGLSPTMGIRDLIDIPRFGTPKRSIPKIERKFAWLVLSSRPLFAISIKVLAFVSLDTLGDSQATNAFDDDPTEAMSK